MDQQQRIDYFYTAIKYIHRKKLTPEETELRTVQIMKDYLRELYEIQYKKKHDHDTLNF